MSWPRQIQDKLSGKHILVTGGAGFIGSNLCGALLGLGAGVTVLDNLSTGNKDNLLPFRNNPGFRFIEGSITDESVLSDALSGIDAVSHQAALGSVPRSIAFPLATHEANATGFLTMLHAAYQSGIKRFVFASSSSVYGDATQSPKVEGNEGNAISPYAVTKQLNEQYAGVYHRLHGMETIGLRYFNMFGPNQNPAGEYAAAIPRFLEAMKSGGTITINGDGLQTRDFTYVGNAVYANLLALSAENPSAGGNVYNVACGKNYTLLEVVENLQNGLIALGHTPKHELAFGPAREGDIRDSLADISAIGKELGYSPRVEFETGILRYLESVL